MKRKKTLILLSMVLAGICAGIVGVKAVEKHVDSIQTIEETVIAVDPEALSEIKWTNESGEVDFVKNDADAAKIIQKFENKELTFKEIYIYFKAFFP